MINIYNLTENELQEARNTQESFITLKSELNQDETNLDEVKSKIATLISLKESSKLEILISYLQNENTAIASSLYKKRNNENELSYRFNINEELIEKAMFEMRIREIPKVSIRKRKTFI